MTHSSLKWAVCRGRIQHIINGVYLMGDEPPSPIELAATVLVATNGVAYGTFAGALYGLDSISLISPYVAVSRKSTRSGTKIVSFPPASVVDVRGYRCTNGVQTMIDLARFVDDITWEQALEAALRKDLLTLPQLAKVPPSRTEHAKRIRRVLGMRPPDTPPTGSLLETLMVQLMRTDPLLPVPERQVEVFSEWGTFAGRVDLALPEYGAFFELDGQGHKDQPVYDAVRQTRVVTATGWLVGRYTWDEIMLRPIATRRSIAQLLAMASQRAS